MISIFNAYLHYDWFVEYYITSTQIILKLMPNSCSTVRGELKCMIYRLECVVIEELIDVDTT